MNGFRIMVCSALLWVSAHSAPAYSQQAENVLKQAFSAFNQGKYDEARRLFRAMAHKNDPAAETMLGVMAARGQGCAPDEAVAAAWYLRAAKRGYAPAQVALAHAFTNGYGVPRDVERAEELLEKAAAQQNSPAVELAERLDLLPPRQSETS